ncbi:hypothetical protein JL09_g6690 [Pichia kudriavzevii]|uniref:Uncharacterized protein n=1 Tax=Pichia kudriavzevii TaxID=4909 RepID=A0A099NJ17_PICKU|nr:hypothetical protein JL09_g6690 [Pichia kudriavzevii]
MAEECLGSEENARSLSK